MTAPLRYVRFHTRDHDCECCGRIIKRGTLELSDGRRYGPQCAARAMGRPRPTTADRREEERLYRAAMAAEYRTLEAARAGWTWTAKGYGGNCGWGSSDAYATPEGPIMHVQDAQTAMLLLEHMPTVVVGVSALGHCYARLTPEQVNAASIAGGAQWTTSRYAEWTFNQGWNR